MGLDQIENIARATPERHRLTHAETELGFDPRWLRARSAAGGRETARVGVKLTLNGESGEIPAIKLDGVILWFDVHRGTKQLPVGTEVVVSYDRKGFYCETVEAVQAFNGAVDKLQEQVAGRRNADLDRRRDAANRQLTFLRERLQFKFHVDIKRVVSGLSTGGNGDGTNRRTVEHLVLDQNISQGNLNRKKGELLCTGTDKGRIANQGDWEPARHIAGDGSTYEPKINCKTCLRRLASLLNKPIEELQ